MTRSIGIVSGKGGVGKTTIAANLGAILASKFKQEIIIVDGNITTPHLGTHLGMYYFPTSLNKVLTGEISVGKALHSYSIKGMKILPASLTLDDSKGVDISELSNVIKTLFGTADIILIDTAPGLGREGMAGIKACEEVIYVTTPFVPDVMDVLKCHQVAQENGVKAIGVVINNRRKGKHELTRNEVEHLLELPVIAEIPHDTDVLKSLASKLTIMDYNSKSRVTKELTRLGSLIVGIEYSKDGLFSRFGGKFKRSRRPQMKTLPFDPRIKKE